MDLVLLVTRQSHCKQGSMACILVSETSNKLQQTMVDRIIGVATNGPIFSTTDSDVHAEIAAIGQVAQSKVISPVSTYHATAYITMPPCKRCFAALVMAGIQRIVTRMPCVSVLQEAAGRHGIELVALGNVQEQAARINQLVERAKQQQLQKESSNVVATKGGPGDEQGAADSTASKRAKLE
eukprot:Nitzschia sp. Nitz4//scaffold22_size323478//10039//10632//NITZ4_000489-RA/size323478-exonerate_protein2genome-gene-0.0-mRNA-1//1//CDS//3329542881//983//frame0